MLWLVAFIAGCGGAGTVAPLPSASHAARAGTIVVTRADDRGTVNATVGDRIQISLGTEYEWRLDPPDGVVLMHGPIQYQLLVRGTQAIWVAAAPGKATITATGTVPCPSGQACIMIAIPFTTTVVVRAP